MFCYFTASHTTSYNVTLLRTRKLRLSSVRPTSEFKSDPKATPQAHALGLLRVARALSPEQPHGGAAAAAAQTPHAPSGDRGRACAPGHHHHDHTGSTPATFTTHPPSSSPPATADPLAVIIDQRDFLSTQSSTWSTEGPER